MSAIVVSAGVGLLCITLVDVFATVLTVRGGGPVTSRLTSGLWRGLLALHRRRSSHQMLAHGGPLIAATTILGWLALLWTSWFLIFSGELQSVVRATTGEPASTWARVYYAGYTLFTLGLGDYRPSGAAWQVLTALAAGNGFLILSLSASYLVPVVSAATGKRTLALSIRGLGASPTEILITGWDGRNFPGLQQHLTSLPTMILQAGQQHLTYPVLHYFHSADPKAALPVQLAVLDEAIHLLECGVQPEHRPPATVTRAAVDAIGHFLASLTGMHTASATTVPPAPSLEALRQAGIPVVSDAEYRRAMAERDEHRCRTLGLVSNTGWCWEKFVHS